MLLLVWTIFRVQGIRFRSLLACLMYASGIFLRLLLSCGFAAVALITQPLNHVTARSVPLQHRVFFGS